MQTLRDRTIDLMQNLKNGKMPLARRIRGMDKIRLQKYKLYDRKNIYKDISFFLQCQTPHFIIYFNFQNG